MSDLRDAALRVVVAADAFLEYERGGSLGMPRPAVPERTEMRNSLAALRKALSNPTSSVSTEGVADGLSEAWAAAEAALPKGWQIKSLSGRFYPVSRLPSHWVVEYMDERGWFRGGVEGPTRIEALTNLLARLTAINPDSPVEPDRG